MKDMLPERKSCRKRLKELRNQLSKELVLSKSHAICKQVLNSDEYKNAKTIFAYVPLGNEVNCVPIIEQAWEDGKRVFLPRTGLESRMDFYEITSFDDVEEGTFHVMEPKTGCKLFVPEQKQDETVITSVCDSILSLVPGVAFDCLGNRYGYGRGYYDRYFGRFPYLFRMALAYTEQLLDELPEVLDTDVKMHAIVTECEVIRMK